MKRRHFLTLLAQTALALPALTLLACSDDESETKADTHDGRGGDDAASDARPPDGSDLVTSDMPEVRTDTGVDLSGDTRDSAVGDLEEIDTHAADTASSDSGSDIDGDATDTAFDSSNDADVAPTCSDYATAISTNHGHTLTVSTTDVDAALDKSYDIQGTSQHTHTVTVTAAHFATLATGVSVVIDSALANGHMHTITVNCV